MLLFPTFYSPTGAPGFLTLNVGFKVSNLLSEVQLFYFKNILNKINKLKYHYKNKKKNYKKYKFSNKTSMTALFYLLAIYCAYWISYSENPISLNFFISC